MCDNFFVINYHTNYHAGGLKTCRHGFAIDKRNRLMLDWADVVVTYVCTSIGGAAKFKALAEKKEKRVINLSRQ